MVELTHSDPTASALTCRGCAGTCAYLVVDLGEQPASYDFPAMDAPSPDAVWPLQLWYCPDCALVQLGPVVALAEEHVRAVGSETSRRHPARTVAAVLTDHAAPAKHGLAIPANRIPIEAVDVLRQRRPDTILILTWNIADEVIAQLETVGWGATYVVPLPFPHPFVLTAVS